MINRKKLITIAISIAVVVATVVWYILSQHYSWDAIVDVQEQERIELLYGIDQSGYEIEEGVVESGSTLSTILAKYGVGVSTIDKISKASDSIFPLRNIRSGNKYYVFMSPDSLRTAYYFVYEQSLKEQVVMSLTGDSVCVKKVYKEVEVRREKRSGTIESSLWNCMVSNNMSPGLAMDLSDIYAWSIDFFALQKGDKFTVIYEQEYIDTIQIGTGQIWGAIFTHGGKDYYAIPYKQGSKMTYWDEQGNSLRKNLLKAPLKFSRISSTFSNSRLHPVLRIRLPHHGVDYAAPSGTPVVAVADGTISFKGYSGGGGNTLKIKHSGNLMSGYLHLKGYGSGIAQGKRVTQGQLIGYVGSTGLSTGPHLDFRLWSNGKPIDPLKVPTTPTEPIEKKNMADFSRVKDGIMEALKGSLSDTITIQRLDSAIVWSGGVGGG